MGISQPVWRFLDSSGRYTILCTSFATTNVVEIESSFNALWAPHTTLRVTYALKSP